MLKINKTIVLASTSPRRQNLLKQLGLNFIVHPSGIEENLSQASSPEEYVLTLSRKKAIEVAKNYNDALIISADTIVVLDGEIINKPKDPDEARQMLKKLSGKTHKVYTGFTILDTKTSKIYSDFEVTDVKFRELEDDEIEQYIATGSPFDKAGAYGIQDDYGAVFVERINGCFYNVVGFPLTKFYLAMKKFLSDD
ncbi:septum formation protein [Candidatus Kryptonium thompsonii]|uniref:dTTP/UTP pyrophosphatase n=1 Tax=Candidatus Kryptonium thompsonii TaxID=1633631 RepID=A0A0P1M255_9BACT|nr:nucleoside triphosphate pyrophosphatase [Candidatus Kryptonium thompsoni]CUS77599.1 septum formation protein [Candidatus Kryptonium thompsoni]CUS85518.1 septum formation protein [Candidatus Kryptonium thompsoni]CUS87310.1 septum formation protein [Candidatus Kryptonium thompsoni]CUS88449.1 septum formation protein [Candidatus Kryptonium thompsoni]CUS90970.1 septum formation protein [Candidatus Kryptonium thompsoni]